MATHGRIVRLMPRSEQLQHFAGWEGRVTELVGEIARVTWQRPVAGLPETVWVWELSTKIRKFSKRFA